MRNNYPNKESKDNKLLNGAIEKMRQQIASQQQTIEGLRKILSVSKCPNCDGSGTVVYSTNEIGEIDDIGPCEWCHEKEQLLNTTEPIDQ